MYPLEIDPTAIQIIARSMTCHPSTLIEAIAQRAREDWAYAGVAVGDSVIKAVTASHEAAIRGRAIVESGKAEDFAADMGAGIIVLNIACKLQCLPQHIRTAAAVRTWGDN